MYPNDDSGYLRMVIVLREARKPGLKDIKDAQTMLGDTISWVC